MSILLVMNSGSTQTHSTTIGWPKHTSYIAVSISAKQKYRLNLIINMVVPLNHLYQHNDNFIQFCFPMQQFAREPKPYESIEAQVSDFYQIYHLIPLSKCY